MKIALLLRGFHYQAQDRFGFPLDARPLLPSLLEQIVTPLRREHAVDLFAITYPSPIHEEVLRLLAPHQVTLLDPAHSTQIKTFLQGLEEIERDSAGPYNRIIVTRFDLVYLKPATEWDIWSRTGIFFPWREYECFWNEHHRVGDALHVIDRPALPAFRASLEALQSQADLHLLYQTLERATPPPLHFIEETGFYDSNTLFANLECTNPLYRIGHRARLRFKRPIASPWLRNLKRRLPPRVWKKLTNFAAWLLRRRSS